jgi:hypothetical protein
MQQVSRLRPDPIAPEDDPFVEFENSGDSGAKIR